MAAPVVVAPAINLQHMDLPIEVEGLYRVDNRFNQDSNTWRNTSAPSTCKNAINFYNVRIATGLYRFDDDGDIVMDAEVQGGWVLCRKTVRNRGGGVLTFAHYMWVLV
uniref:At1g24996 n=1 Tax=Arabidopsis thaliana TaxID=3702 RepID=A2RVT5_ARATH|nr:At1g24996 [Arabidopsis thaliana]